VHISTLATSEELHLYETWIRSHRQGTLWQSVVRKKYVEACGKETRIYGISEQRPTTSGQFLASALVVIDRTIGGYSTWEIPRGPLWQSDKLQASSFKPAEALLERIVQDAKREHCIALYLSPSHSLAACSLQLAASPRHIHCEATRMIDLTLDENQILAQMHPKGRYNIAVAEKHGVTVREGTENDTESFYALLQATGKRDGFTVSQKSHYRRFLDCIEGSFILIAEHAKKPVAGLIGVRWGTTGIYYYGASSYEYRNLMAPYLLQWEAMKKCKAMGCTKYDLLGIEPPEEKPQAKSLKLQALHPWAGISDFKRKFGGSIVIYPPEQMMVLRPFMYNVITMKRRLLG